MPATEQRSFHPPKGPWPRRSEPIDASLRRRHARGLCRRDGLGCPGKIRAVPQDKGLLCSRSQTSDSHRWKVKPRREAAVACPRTPLRRRSPALPHPGGPDRLRACRCRSSALVAGRELRDRSPGTPSLCQLASTSGGELTPCGRNTAGRLFVHGSSAALLACAETARAFEVGSGELGEGA